MTYYKVLAKDHTAVHGGTFTYSPARGKRPGTLPPTARSRRARARAQRVSPMGAAVVADAVRPMDAAQAAAAVRTVRPMDVAEAEGPSLRPSKARGRPTVGAAVRAA